MKRVTTTDIDVFVMKQLLCHHPEEPGTTNGQEGVTQERCTFSVAFKTCWTTWAKCIRN